MTLNILKRSKFGNYTIGEFDSPGGRKIKKSLATANNSIM